MITLNATIVLFIILAGSKAGLSLATGNFDTALWAFISIIWAGNAYLQARRANILQETIDIYKNSKVK